MELAGKNYCLSVVCFTVLVLCPLVKGNCQQQLMQDSGAMKCIMGLGTYMANLGSGGMNLSDPEGVSKLICSPEGKSAFSCIIGYVKKCPELMTSIGGAGNPMDALGQIPGFDLQMFMEEGGLDGACAMLVGPCSEVNKCFIMSQPGSVGGVAGGMVAKRAAPAQTNYYMLFQTLTSMMCGMMKDQMECMLKALEKCPPNIVTKIETQFEKGLNMSMPDTYGVVSYKDTKRFIEKECPKLPKNFSENSCVKGVFVSQNFEICNEIVAKKYSQKRSCEVHHLSKQCINEHVQPKCGKEMALFLVRNTYYIFPGIPDNCETSSDSSKGSSGGDVKQASFGIQLISTFFALLLYVF